jgi:hypothetical protein
MNKNVDLLAITLLLVGLAFVSRVKESAVLGYQSARLVSFTSHQLQQLSVYPHIPQMCMSRD